MSKLGDKIAQKRKDLGMTQELFAEKMGVTRQTVSRWETGSVMPDVDKIGDIASLLGVSCDYLLKDEMEEEGTRAPKGVSRLLLSAKGKIVRFSFFEDEADIDLFNADCEILEFEGNWMRVAVKTKKGRIEKLIPVSCVSSMEVVKEAE